MTPMLWACSTGRRAVSLSRASSWQGRGRFGWKDRSLVFAMMASGGNEPSKRKCQPSSPIGQSVLPFHNRNSHPLFAISANVLCAAECLWRISRDHADSVLFRFMLSSFSTAVYLAKQHCFLNLISSNARNP